MADDERDAAFLTSLTTEHFGLAGARSTTVSESAGRSALFLASVSSTLIALGFVAQVADETFRLFALAALPILAFLGLATFVRVLAAALGLAEQSGIPRRRLTLVDRAATYSHNDPNSAAPRNEFVRRLVPYLRRVALNR